jgi:hypothetical protein
MFAQLVGAAFPQLFYWPAFAATGVQNERRPDAPREFLLWQGHLHCKTCTVVPSLLVSFALRAVSWNRIVASHKSSQNDST